MEYQNIMNLLDNTPNQPTKFSTKSWDEINGTYSTGSQIKFKISMLKSRLSDYRDPYILVGETILVGNTAY